MDSGECPPTKSPMTRGSKLQGRFKWTRERLISYLGGDENDLGILKVELTDLLLEHDKMYLSCRTRDGRAQQRKFILANITKIRPYVQDCNLRRLEGLMGLARVVKRTYKAGERYKSVTAQMSQSRQDDGEKNNGTEGELKDKTDIMVFTPIPTPTPTPTLNTPKPNQPIKPKPQLPRTIAKARNLLAKRQVPTHQFPDFGLNLLARNIWVVNETDPNRHGLCAIQELQIGPYYPTDRIPCLTDLNFIEWVITTKEQCGYNEELHRLEYRPSATVSPLVVSGQVLTVPVVSLRQWRGALNAQLRDNPDRDPVFYLIFKCELVG
ncbi:hypothetical protein BO94DRAFT_524565 [Aspergillus sclerotioniger CBS 115572]|uniref:Uncharacterized protein n=1 Tax=Aspergillus sclerotioniger CBS 115572 TaxID=1450535 RepID=A0A317VJS5_9EURO|nr:hypothetical protein BO94DRAFT_524565 [Aspergillus sclerotioniger CBS 115572]PWY74604.1 hypothetical protein BO94DRAFT_524565 [Aspergillus sclerotioniger CBS 115572]